MLKVSPQPQEQQIAGWTQVSAHGTGARIPPVDVSWWRDEYNDRVQKTTTPPPPPNKKKIIDTQNSHEWKKIHFPSHHFGIFWVSCYTCQISGVYASAKVTKDRLIQPLGNLETFGRLHIWLTKPSFRIRLRSDKVFVHDFSHDATHTSLITSMLFYEDLGMISTMLYSSQGIVFQWRPKQVDRSRQVRSDLNNSFGEVSPGKRICCPSNKN